MVVDGPSLVVGAEDKRFAVDDDVLGLGRHGDNSFELLSPGQWPGKLGLGNSSKESPLNVR
jgi:hypothetical protein